MINHFTDINGKFSNRSFKDGVDQKKTPLLEGTIYEFPGGVTTCEARWLRIPVQESLALRGEDCGDSIEAPLIMHIVEDYRNKA